MPAWLRLMLLAWPCALQGQVRINELQAARTPGGAGLGAQGDWVELYNAGRRKVELEGHLLVLNGHAQKLAPGLAIAAGGHLVLWCDNAPESGPAHLGINLPREGGALLLVAPDKTTVLDIFRWPALPPGASIGRRTDGGRGWGFFAPPTPGAPNRGALASWAPATAFREEGPALALQAGHGAAIRYTVDGSLPQDSSRLYASPLQLPAGTVVRARAFAPDAVPGPEAVYTTGVPADTWALAMDPGDLGGPGGIADTLAGNHVRTGRDWQRQAWLQQGSEVWPVGMAIAGSGSRSLPKRNFKLLVRDRFQGQGPLRLPDGSHWKELMLRADATPHAFLRNAFIKEVAARSGARVDVQPSFPVELQLNGTFQGLYRAMPAKGKEWLGSLAKGEAVEVVEGPGIRAVNGGNTRYLELLKDMDAGVPMAKLAEQADLGSLVDLACFDLWTGRADHELNMRAWRPRTKDGRWRWVLYDMDLWAPVQDRTVARMCMPMVQEAPYLPQILADAEMQDRLLARFAALCATTLHPDLAVPLADSLYQRYGQQMQQDYLRWKDAMPAPAPEEAHAALLAHIAGRGGAMLKQLSAYTGRPLRALSVRTEPEGAGTVELEGLPLAPHVGAAKVFAEVPLQLHARPHEGMEFAGWRGLEQTSGPDATAVPGKNLRITAVFRPVGLSRQGGLQQRGE